MSENEKKGRLLKRVLIVDDSRWIRVELKEMLEDIGFKVVGEANDGLEAVSMNRELKPEIKTRHHFHGPYLAQS